MCLHGFTEVHCREETNADGSFHLPLLSCRLCDDGCDVLPLRVARSFRSPWRSLLPLRRRLRCPLFVSRLLHFERFLGCAWAYRSLVLHSGHDRHSWWLRSSKASIISRLLLSVYVVVATSS